MPNKSFLITAVVLLLFVLFQIDVEAQCAMCKQAVKSNLDNAEGSRKIGIGINTGILYLMSIPYLIAGTIAFAFYRKRIVAKVQSLIKAR
jgi:hypothetical protein